MARLDPRLSVLFSLVPKNDRAEQVVAHPDNKHLVSTALVGVPSIDVGFPEGGKSSATLVTIGRGIDADIYVEGSSIAKIQCSFEADLDTGIVMFYDRSHGATSQVFGKHVTQFEHGRTRRVVVQKGLNDYIGIGGVHRNLVFFYIKWHHDLGSAAIAIKQYGLSPVARRQHLRVARTVDEAPTELPSHRETRLHTAGPALKVRYEILDRLGSGSFGEVHKAVDVDSGRVMAVKILRRPQDLAQQAMWKDAVQHSLQREIKVLSSIKHRNIIDYITSQGWFDSNIEIFMGLKEGTLGSLIENGVNVYAIANTVLHHMLQALDCIASRDIIHRDVKPENILYTTQSDGQYLFQLGDFGLCNRALEAKSNSGTPVFKAPEVTQGGQQSCKADVWSLLVTLLVMLNIRGFRYMQFRSHPQLYHAISDAASDTQIARAKEMAVFDPLRRASAAQMLVKLYDGEGLSTPRDQIPALPGSLPIMTAPGEHQIIPPPAVRAQKLRTLRRVRGRA